ncbi:rRNA maturation RNase YbeY [Psychrobacter sp. NPDC078370]|uniref:Endoribonuclease YbeY n=1 Tax=Psychrobacter nivimaris TaxID=281738 RepID=A0A6N7C109_9GAMM|nr:MULTISPECIES: rRNA maturation RNase YbeY [Psychrobacter]KAF0569046.1 Metal-dependent hydrolase [Psychrobacter nivimaris]PLT22702.1 rRNA maturation RNase YbeY [Psychrobacter sp. MES7-P7E]
MSQPDNTNVDDKIASNHASLAALDISATDSIDDEILDTFYNREHLLSVMMATLDYIDGRINTGLTLPYFADIVPELWQEKSKTLDIYITDEFEGRALNLEARGKDYATNILSYPSELPAAVIELMPTLPLGELVICHEVMVREAAEQDKTVAQHISHLLVHGVLHLLGFDHELGQAEQDEMEYFEIDILAGLNLPNPYI